MGGRGGITEQVVENSVVALGGNDFETGIITVEAGATIKKGVVLKRAGNKFAPVVDTSPITITADVGGAENQQIPIPGTTVDTPVAVNPFDISNLGIAAADMSIRALVSGPVRADLLTINGDEITDAQGDMLRDYGIIPVKVADLSRIE
jgi:hypothetical protein